MNDIFKKSISGDAPVRAANSLGIGHFRIGVSGNFAAPFYGPRSVINNGNQFIGFMVFASEIRDDLREKRLALKMFVVRVCELARGSNNADSDEIKISLRQFCQHAAHKALADSVGFYNAEGGLFHGLIISRMRSKSSKE